MAYKIFRTEEFIKNLYKIDNSLKIKIEKELKQLENNPYSSKPLGYSFFREKKINNYRVYYLIYDELLIVFLIGISNKKDQQKVINRIKYLIPYYKNLINKLK